MALASIYPAGEALSLPPEQREQLAKLLLASLKPDGGNQVQPPAG